ncbi:hypothetical protein CBL_06120 [Carabus blaptoides fortunei]
MVTRKPSFLYHEHCAEHREHDSVSLVPKSYHEGCSIEPNLARSLLKIVLDEYDIVVAPELHHNKAGSECWSKAISWNHKMAIGTHIAGTNIIHRPLCRGHSVTQERWTSIRPVLWSTATLATKMLAAGRNVSQHITLLTIRIPSLLE